MPTFVRLVNRPVVAILAVAAIAGGLRFYHLSYPKERIFDEVYYSKDACNYLGEPAKVCGVTSKDDRYWRRTRGEVSWVHPPLGKWAIAIGEEIYGIRPFGWRFSSAVFGTLSVVALALIAQLLFGSPLWTFVAGLLLATESLNFVQSRTSMLDIFLTFWVVLGFLFLVLDRRWIDRRTVYPPEEPEPESPVEQPPAPSPLWRPWRLAAGVAFGAGFATKWSAATAIFAAVVLSLLWERTRRKRTRAAHPVRRMLFQESFGSVVAFLVVPVVVYVASYTPWFVDHGVHLSGCLHVAEKSYPDTTHDWCNLQNAMRDYHQHLKTTEVAPKTREVTPIHPYLSRAWKWIFLLRPVLYFARYPTDAYRRVIYANGNPAIFWGTLFAIPYLLALWRKRRDWRAGFVTVAVLGQYLPWFVVSRPLFLFYMTPVTPFLALACTYAAKDLSELHVAGSRSRPYLPVAAGFVALSVGLFLFFFPVLTGAPISTLWFTAHTWMKGWV